jgi:hypothetical protein
MKQPLLKLLTTLLCAGLFCALAFSAQAQTQSTNKAPAEKKSSSSAEKKQTAGPFHGKLAALDKSAKTITVGKRTFHVSPDAKIVRNNKSATLDDGVVDEIVSGYFKTGDDGKLIATKVTFGPKTDSKSADKKKK